MKFKTNRKAVAELYSKALTQLDTLYQQTIPQDDGDNTTAKYLTEKISALKTQVEFSLGNTYAKLTNQQNPEYLFAAWHYLFPLCSSNKEVVDILYYMLNQLEELPSQEKNPKIKYQLMAWLFTQLNNLSESD